MTDRVAFIGLGVMGAPMARNLLSAGYDVFAYNRSRSKAADFEKTGGSAASSIREAVENASVIITMLPDSPDVAQVMQDDGGVFRNAPSDALVIDMSTIRPDVSRALAASARQRFLRPLDAPVSGGEAAAVGGTLSIMVGGYAEDVEEARPLLSTMGTTVIHVGGDGAGQAVKSANQLLVAGHLELLSEAIVLLSRLDVDVESGLRAIGAGLAGSAVLDRKAAHMLDRNFEPGFRVELHHKDLGIVLDTAQDLGLSLPLAGPIAELVRSLRERHGHLDHSALLLQVEAMAVRGEGVR